MLDANLVVQAGGRPARPSLRDLVCARGARSCQLELCSPWRFAACAQAPGEVRSFRRSAPGEFGSTGARPRAEVDGLDGLDAADYQAWHLLARRRETGELIGCIRFTVFERARLAEVVDAVLQNSGCQFSPEDGARCRMALCEYWASWLRQSGPFMQIGGLTVAASARRSALASVLCLAANAFMRVRGSRFGVVFGSERAEGVGLYENAGCAPMALGPGLLPALTDLFSHDRTLVMRCDPYAVRADFAPEVEQLHTDLLQAQALELRDH